MRKVEKSVEALFDDAGPLAFGKPEYSRRDQQVDLAHAVNRALLSRGVLLADAPTGTGKSLAYLAPAALAGEKVVVSTATIALQHQLLSEDIPPLRRAVCRQLGYPEDEGFSYAVMKGRRNFLCSQRYQETLRVGSLHDEAMIGKLDLWSSQTETGDREDLDFAVPAGAWAEIASDGEDCAPASCPFREGCFYYAHRDRAMEADLLVVNHALLLANAASGGAIFDLSERHLIVDEAHRLEDVMGEAFGARVSFGRVRYAMRQARKKSAGATEAADGAVMAAETFFDELEVDGKLGGESRAPRAYQNLLDALTSVRESLANDPKEEANNLATMVGRLKSDFKSFYREPEETHAYAITPGKSRIPGREAYPELRSWLVDTEVAFREIVLPMFEDRAVILTSATLANGRSANGKNPGADSPFSYARGRLGLGESESVEVPARGSRKTRNNYKKVREHVGAEIFDYPERCLLYLEREIEAPGRGGYERFTSDCVRRVEELVGLSGGRALVLLSTNRALRAFRESLDVPYPVKFQGDDSPGRLVAWLKESEGGVLVGTRTFWEGIDVPGEAVSCVVIDRVPFPPPDDPIISKLCEKAGKNWFSEVSLPKAQISLRQGAGRLMRRSDDRGVIALLDSRMNHKSWGKVVVRSLPEAPVTDSLEDVRTFFEDYEPG